MSDVRAESKEAGKWLRLGRHSWVCGDWTIGNFLVSGAEKFILFKNDVRVAICESLKDAASTAREAERKAA